MKLFVDDIRNAPDQSWHVARTVDSAIRAIAQFNFEEISLDHDISHQVIMTGVERPYPCLETFQPVAHFIGMKFSATGNKPAKLYVHSSNPVGANSIVDVLKGYGLQASSTLGKAANRLELEV